jgi:protein-disulfide isomerase/uncharacterized membrane protein
MRDNVEIVMSGILNSLAIPHSRKQLNNRILSHPHYPSLAAITDVLDDYKVNNVAFHANFDRLKEEVELPVVVYLKERNGIFGLLHKITDKHAYLTTETSTHKEYPIDTFKELWTGIILLAEKDKDSGEQFNAEQLKSIRMRKIRMAIPIVGFTIAIAACLTTSFSWPLALLFATKLAGLFFVSLLVAHELGEESALSDKLCTLTKSTGCNEVLKSKASSIMGIVKLSDIGFAYFTSTLLALLIGIAAGTANSAIGLIAWLPLLAIPYVVFSVTYQLLVVKKWCPFCMGVIGLLVAEAVAAVAYGLVALELPTIGSILLYGIALLIIITVWIVVKPMLKRLKEASRFEHLYTRLKRKPEVIKGILAESDYTEIPTVEGELILGNPNATFTITEVVNPYCSPCAKSFDKLNELLKEAGNNFKVQFRFLVKSNREDKSTKVAAHILALTEKLSPEELRNALDIWFKERDYEKWKKEYPAKVDEHIYQRLEAQQEWANGLGINATPTIYVNGYRWKLDMDLYDLKYSL